MANRLKGSSCACEETYFPASEEFFHRKIPARALLHYAGNPKACHRKTAFFLKWNVLPAREGCYLKNCLSEPFPPPQKLETQIPEKVFHFSLRASPKTPSKLGCELKYTDKCTLLILNDIHEALPPTPAGILRKRLACLKNIGALKICG